MRTMLQASELRHNVDCITLIFLFGIHIAFLSKFGTAFCRGLLFNPLMLQTLSRRQLFGCVTLFYSSYFAVIALKINSYSYCNYRLWLEV